MIKKIFPLILCSCLAAGSAAAQENSSLDAQIKLRSGPIFLEKSLMSEFQPSIFGNRNSFVGTEGQIQPKGVFETLAKDQAGPRPTKERVVVQFEKTPSLAERDALRERGIFLGDYIGNRSYYATRSNAPLPLTPKVFSEVVGADGIRLESIDSLTERYKTFKIDETAQSILPDLPSDESVALQLKIFSDVDVVLVEGALQRMGLKVLSRSITASTITLLTTPQAVASLRRLREVELISIAPPAPTTYNDGLRKRLGTHVFDELKLTGDNVRIGIFDGGIVSDQHPGFKNRLTIGESQSAVSAHGTHVAGTLAGDGTEDTITASTPAFHGATRYRGVAPNAHLFSYDFFDEPHDKHIAAIKDHRIRIANNSWGYDPGIVCIRLGDYTAEAAAYDRIVSENKLPIIFAIGNNRNKMQVCGNGCGCDAFDGAPDYANYYVVPSPSTAKNVIVVGAINSDDRAVTRFTNFGPTDDGRLKPEIVAPGCERAGDGGITSTLPPNRYGLLPSGACGTSFAAPAVSGVIAILMEYLGKGSHKASLLRGDLALPATYKAVLLHSAEDLGNLGPDFQTGYGLIDAAAALKLLSDRHVSEGIIADSGTQESQTISVASGTGHLRATLVWDDPPSAVGKATALVNDLDVVVVSPSGTRISPWLLDPSAPRSPAKRGKDSLNVVEVIDVKAPEAGNWTVIVEGTDLPLAPQSYALVVSTE